MFWIFIAIIIGAFIIASSYNNKAKQEKNITDNILLNQYASLEYAWWKNVDDFILEEHNNVLKIIEDNEMNNKEKHKAIRLIKEKREKELEKEDKIYDKERRNLMIQINARGLINERNQQDAIQDEDRSKRLKILNNSSYIKQENEIINKFYGNN